MIHYGIKDRLYLGNLDAKRDWGHARDFVEGIWRILQYPEPDDFVLATGECHSVRKFVEMAFARIGTEIVWQGEGVEETGIDAQSGRTLVEIDPWYFRPTEVNLLRGDATKAREKLGWAPTVSFDALIDEMVESDLRLIAQQNNISVVA